jgi:hypothetical protein
MRNESPERWSIHDALSGCDTNQEGKAISSLGFFDAFLKQRRDYVIAVHFPRLSRSIAIA